MLAGGWGTQREKDFFASLRNDMIGSIGLVEIWVSDLDQVETLRG